MTSVVRAIALLGFDEFASSQGLDPRQLLMDVGLPVDTPERLESMIAYSRYIALLDLCAKQSGNPLFGLQFGLHQGAQVLGNLLYIIQNAKTVHEALKALKTFFHVHSSGGEVRLEFHGENAWLTYDVTDGDATSVRQDVELAMGVGTRLMQSLLGSRWHPSALQLRHSAAAAPSVYRHLLGVTPRFDSQCNAWIFDARLLDAQLSAADERLQQLIQRHVQDLERITLQELPAYVQRLLWDMLPNGKVTIEDVAGYMMISPRTLQRYLLAEDTGFQELLDKTRQSMSIRYICDSSISLTQLAGLLGYAELSTFSRAFTRWNGASPRKWKQRYIQDQAGRLHAAEAASQQPRPD
ncbi:MULTISPECIES: AraC family transcriptional regulator [unclassified Pseudomonas]|uniref:AraC-like transcriptional regulator QhpR n=1 Tax=unclassified Pseudomonas TaxID=196821 RepID=UPI001EDCB489|nr:MULTISPECIES: AraC family transcriptional regulator [unclassified Pseudomonas]MCG4453272.1 AraC family transcriptional regulator [Pseudomonas sp. MMS21 TM103]